jgi:hypothetical protein
VCFATDGGDGCVERLEERDERVGNRSNGASASWLVFNLGIVVAIVSSLSRKDDRPVRLWERRSFVLGSFAASCPADTP